MLNRRGATGARAVRGRSRRRGARSIAALLATGGLLAAPALAAAQGPAAPPTRSTASGQGVGEFGSGPGPFPFSFSMSVGPAGEAPEGTFSFGGGGTTWMELSGRVTCVSIVGNRVSAGGIIESGLNSGNGVAFLATDNGPTGDTVSVFAVVAPQQAADCRSYSITERPVAAGGGVVVHDLARLKDGTPPVLTVPGPMTVDATEPGGALVSFSATATDDREPPPSVACDPASGSLFPAGATTAVTCVARDGAGNTTSASFTVRVLGGCEQIAALATKAIDGAGLPPAVAERLKAALVPVLGRCATTPKLVTCRALEGFTVLVRLGAGRAIPTGLAQELLADAARIRTALAC